MILKLDIKIIKSKYKTELEKKRESIFWLKYIKKCGCALLGAWQLAEFMVMQRRGNVLLNKFLNRSLKK
jgi:hypothetical protein